MVWITPPMPIAPYQATRWRLWFMARVATRSPRFSAHAFKRLRELPRIACDAGPVGAGLGAVGPVGDDLAPAMLALGMVDQPRHAQLAILHPAQHRTSSVIPRSGIQFLMQHGFQLSRRRGGSGSRASRSFGDGEAPRHAVDPLEPRGELGVDRKSRPRTRSASPLGRSAPSGGAGRCRRARPRPRRRGGAPPPRLSTSTSSWSRVRFGEAFEALQRADRDARRLLAGAAVELDVEQGAVARPWRAPSTCSAAMSSKTVASNWPEASDSVAIM